MSVSNDIYEKSGGDAAWSMWFNLCSVGRVRESDISMADGLAEHISSTMLRQLKRTGYASDEFNKNDAVSFFDTFFLLGSKQKVVENRKPLKQLLINKMASGIPLKEMVCGVLFSPRHGRIIDIVRDWIATVKGWKWRTISKKDGTRKIVRESAVESDFLSDTSRAAYYSFGLNLDVEAFGAIVSKMFSSLENSIGLEKSKIALLLYVTANAGSLDDSTVLEKLGVKKSTAYILRSKCLKAAADYLEKNDIRTDNVAFAAKLLAFCKVVLDGESLSKLLK